MAAFDPSERMLAEIMDLKEDVSSIGTKLDMIHEEAKKTNGRVTELESGQQTIKTTAKLASGAIVFLISVIGVLGAIGVIGF